MTSGPLNPMVLAHPSAVQRCREIMGPTKSYVAQIAAPHSIRGMYGLTDTRNSIHGSGESVLDPAAESVYKDCCCEAQSISLRQTQSFVSGCCSVGEEPMFAHKTRHEHSDLHMPLLIHPSIHSHTHTHTHTRTHKTLKRVCSEKYRSSSLTLTRSGG